ncbi:hypothetical protein [Dyadobacter sandarakinus]|uniref:Outer membrane protein beta-barrel domain-containing protein n=1 Tax=Dyadobacter sandarakinus TaxID=2747268 RepID=A0ABX7I9J7_9BACT|nr:hypothetical protein [Dyadobacter sandarakinus]QRR01848.1 hypothetical protein HWI92_13480 [Dyadobacter sandarakinus]
MKNILLTSSFLLCICTSLLAQHEGKKFISGIAGVNFQNQHSAQQSSQNTYNISISPELGKFKTNNRAEGFRLNAALSGGKRIFAIVDGEEVRQNGITGAGGGIGYFWQYYRHFNGKAGIFAGPNVRAQYDYAKTLEFRGQVDIGEKISRQISLSAGLEAGAYYMLTERWWLLATLGFSTPLSLSYNHDKTELASGNAGTANQAFTYDFKPALQFPSVGLGLRYVLK